MNICVHAQKKLDINSITISEPHIGEEYIIKKKNGAYLKNGRYKILGPNTFITFKIRKKKLVSPIQYFSTSTGRLTFKISTENYKVIETNKYVNYADESRNVAPLILSEKKVLKGNIYCETVFDDSGNKTYKRCTEGDTNHNDDDFNEEDNDKEIYLFQCSTLTKEPNNKYCEEFDYKLRISKYYKNYVLYKEVKALKDANNKKYFITTNYDSTNHIINKIYEYPDSIKTVYADESYSIEIKKDSRTSAIKVSFYTMYDKNGNQTFTEKREKQRFFDGTTKLKRTQKNKIIIETYDNNRNLINSEEK